MRPHLKNDGNNQLYNTNQLQKCGQIYLNNYNRNNFILINNIPHKRRIKKFEIIIPHGIQGIHSNQIVAINVGLPVIMHGIVPVPIEGREATIGGVASNNLYNNPSTPNTSLLYLNVFVNNKSMKVMIDTGANRSFISIKSLRPSYAKQFVNQIHSRVILADDHTSISVLGTINLSIAMDDMLTSIRAFVVTELCADCILGMDFINKYKLIINIEEQIVSVIQHV
jgi:hypothetical protein